MRFDPVQVPDISVGGVVPRISHPVVGNASGPTDIGLLLFVPSNAAGKQNTRVVSRDGHVHIGYFLQRKVGSVNTVVSN